jgi:HSP20 family molecular chaperone IbpA
MYATDCYIGKMVVYPIEMVMGTTTEVVEVEVFQPDGQNILHVFLAKEGGEAGQKYNAATFEFLNSRFTSIGATRKETVLRTFLLQSKEVMKRYFKNDLVDPFLEWNPTTQILRMKVHAKTQKGEDKPKPLALVRDSLGTDGFSLSLSSSDSFKLQCDVFIVKGGVAWKVVADVPGFVLETDYQKEPQKYATQSRINYYVDRETNMLVLQGVRKLSHYGLDFNGEPKFNENIKVGYTKATKLDANVRRTSGYFERRFMIPVEFSRDERDFKVSLRHGQLEILLPKIYQEKVQEIVQDY